MGFLASGIRCASLMLVSAIAVGCSTPSFPPPDKILLDEPSTDLGLIYLIRAPHDKVKLDIREGDKIVAQLPPETYVALTLPPGKHTFVTTTRPLVGSPISMRTPLEIAVQPNQRRFFLVSVSSARPTGTLINAVDVISKFPAAIAIPISTEPVESTRVWEELTESDARPLISIASPLTLGK